MSEIPQSNEKESESDKLDILERRGFFKNVLVASVGVALVLAGCATVDQNIKPQSAESENDRPEWVNGDQVFEKDGYIYAVGKAEIDETGDLTIPTDLAYKMAENNICEYLIGDVSLILKDVDHTCSLPKPSEHVDRAIVSENGNKYIYIIRRHKPGKRKETELEKHFREEYERLTGETSEK